MDENNNCIEEAKNRVRFYNVADPDNTVLDRLMKVVRLKLGNDKWTEKNNGIHGKGYTYMNHDLQVSCSYDPSVRAWGALVFYDEVDPDIFDGRCPMCGETKIIPTSCDFSDEAFHLEEQGKVDLLPGAYDRPGVPWPNQRCSKCGFRWFDQNGWWECQEGK